MKNLAYAMEYVQKIDSDKSFYLRIGIAEVDHLKPHEESVPESLEKLLQAIKESRFLKNPIIVDFKSDVILDGMHRWYVFKKLGYDYIGVCYVDYKSPLIKLGRWFRFFKGNAAHYSITNWIENFLEENSIPVEWIDRNSLNNLDITNTAIVLIKNIDDVLAIKANHRKKHEFYHVLKSMCTGLKNNFGLTLYYKPDVSFAKLPELLDTYSLILATPVVEKEEVLKVALSGKVFPPKTTRHEIPARPMFVNFPINLLKSSIVGDLHTVNRYFRNLLRHKNIIHLRPGLELDREYREDIILFWDTRVGVP